VPFKLCRFARNNLILFMSTDKHWYVVYTNPRNEKKVAARLTDTGFTNYCPLNRVERQWSDRKKIVQEPLFRTYVFVHVNESEKWKVREVPGVLNYVYWLGKPALVRESEIQTIQRFLNDHPSVEVETLTELLPNQPITIVSGLFMGQEGIVQNVSGNKVQVHIVSLGVILKATLPREAVQLK